MPPTRHKRHVKVRPRVTKTLIILITLRKQDLNIQLYNEKLAALDKIKSPSVQDIQERVICNFRREEFRRDNLTLMERYIEGQAMTWGEIYDFFHVVNKTKDNASKLDDRYLNNCVSYELLKEERREYSCCQ